MLELESTYLIKNLPQDFIHDYKNWTSNVLIWSKEIIDMYLPKESDHPKIRLRKNWEKYELTKKEPVNQWDASMQKEQTIILTQSEFELFASLEWKKVEKIRYFYNYNWYTAEIDIFKWELSWLIVVDFEFRTIEDKNNFEKPNFCLADITQDDFIAWWVIAWKKYSDIETILVWYNYSKITLDEKSI